MSEPVWLAKARELLGLKEIVGSENEAKVVAFFKDAGNPGVKDDETAWCAAFVGAMLVRSGIKGTGKLNARSYLDWGDKLTTPRVGAITVFRRGNSSWQGHVAFFLRDLGATVEVLGGNQGNAVSIARYAKADVLGYRWPAEAPRAEQPDDPGNAADEHTPQPPAAVEAGKPLIGAILFVIILIIAAFGIWNWTH